RRPRRAGARRPGGPRHGDRPRGADARRAARRGGRPVLGVAGGGQRSRRAARRPAAAPPAAAPRQTALLRVLRGGEFGAAVVLTLEDGLITRCVCTDESEAERLSGSAELSADVEWAALMDAIGAVDPWAEFAALLDAAPRQRGLEAVRRALRGQAAAVR